MKCQVVTDLSGKLLAISREDCESHGDDAPTHSLLRPSGGQRLYRLEIDPKILRLPPEEMFEELGVRYIKSPTNFTFFETGIPVDELNAELLSHGIMSGRAFPPFTTWSRISMQTPEEMRYYVQTFKQLFANRILDAAA